MAEHDTTPENEIHVEVETEGEAPGEPAGTPMERFFYHQRRALEETARALEALLPPGFKEHATEASREFAKGFRILVDSAIDELKKISEKDEEEEEEAAKETKAEAEPEVEPEKTEEQPRKPTTGKTKVKVKVD